MSIKNEREYKAGPSLFRRARLGLLSEEESLILFEGNSKTVLLREVFDIIGENLTYTGRWIVLEVIGPIQLDSIPPKIKMGIVASADVPERGQLALG